MKKKNDYRRYPCPKCATGQLRDTGGMFLATIECSNPKCKYTEMDSYCDLTTSD